jgi:hypothetical protein
MRFLAIGMTGLLLIFFYLTLALCLTKYWSNSFSFLYIIVQRGYFVVTTLNIAK